MSRYWLSFDLGLSGNYDGLYEWLDNANAKECADSTATFATDKTPEDIEAELSKLFELSKQLNERARIYLVAKRGTRYTGRFILGGRKQQAPWTGYGRGIVEVDEEA